MRLIAQGRGDRASVAEITQEADLGFGSFRNHFDGKDLLDPAELFAVGLRISGRLGWTHPDIAGSLTGAALDALDSCPRPGARRAPGRAALRVGGRE